MARNSGDESEHHVVAVRMRATGAGNLHMALQDLDNVQTQNLVDMPLNATTRIEVTRLANFQSQRIRLNLSTDQLNDVFHIRRILIFAKPVAVEYPG